MPLQDAPATPAPATPPAIEIVPPGQPALAGPWRLTVREVQAGEQAAASLLAANAGNADAPEGLVYVLVSIRAENAGDVPLALNLSDFAATGTDGVLRRPPALIVPEPSLQTTVEPGAAADGWLPLLVNDPSNLVLRFTSPFLGGTWSHAVLGLTDGATIPAFAPPGPDPQRGLSPDAPAAFNETVRAGSWDVTALEHISGQDVFAIAEFALQALAGSDPNSPEVATWHAVRVRATNVGPVPAFFSFTALRLAAPDGEPWDHVLALTPPIPDVARELLPGATREGWAAFQLQPWATLDLLRVQPSRLADDPRFISFTATAGGAPRPASAPTLAEGDHATVAEDRVNLRAQPSASAEIVAELARDTEVTITGAPVDADGYVWYPVTVSGGATGYVVADFLAPADGR